MRDQIQSSYPALKIENTPDYSLFLNSPGPSRLITLQIHLKPLRSQDSDDVSMREQVCASILIDMDSVGGRNLAIVSDCRMEPKIFGGGVPPLPPIPGKTSIKDVRV